MPEHTTVATISQAIGSRRRVQHWFYIAVGLLVILLNIAGFGPSLLDGSMRNSRPSSLVVIHGVVASAWLLLFLAQATLVATGRTGIHRRLGAIAPALTVVMIVLTFQTTIEMVRRGHDLSGDLYRPAAAPGAPVPSVAEVPSEAGSVRATYVIALAEPRSWDQHFVSVLRVQVDTYFPRP